MLNNLSTYVARSNCSLRYTRSPAERINFFLWAGFRVKSAFFPMRELVLGRKTWVFAEQFATRLFWLSWEQDFFTPRLTKPMSLLRRKLIFLPSTRKSICIDSFPKDVFLGFPSRKLVFNCKSTVLPLNVCSPRTWASCLAPFLDMWFWFWQPLTYCAD